MLGHAPGRQGGARRRRRAVRRVLDQRGLRAVHPQGQGRRPDDDRPDRREPLGLRREQARVRASVVRALQGRRPAAGDRPAVQRLRPAAGRRRRDPRHDAAGAAARADHALQRRHADPRVVLRRRLRRRRAALRGEAGGDRPGVQPRQPAGHDHQLRARQHDHPADATRSRTIVFKPHPGPEVDLRVPSIEKAATLLGFSRRCRSRRASRARSRGTREHMAAVCSRATVVRRRPVSWMCTPGCSMRRRLRCRSPGRSSRSDRARPTRSGWRSFRCARRRGARVDGRSPRFSRRGRRRCCRHRGWRRVANARPWPVANFRGPSPPSDERTCAGRRDVRPRARPADALTARVMSDPVTSTPAATAVSTIGSRWRSSRAADLRERISAADARLRAILH